MSAARSSGRPRGIQHEESRGLVSRDREESAADTGVEVLPLSLEPVERLVVRVEPAAGDGRIQVEQHGEVGQQPASRPHRQIADLAAVRACRPSPW